MCDFNDYDIMDNRYNYIAHCARLQGGCGITVHNADIVKSR